VRGVLGPFLIALALAPAGCTSAQKKKSSPPVNVPSSNPNRPFWADNGSPTASIPGPGRDPVNTPANDPEVSGILAGRVIDSYQRPVIAGSVQVIEMASAAPRPPTEIELEPNNQGRFYIRGLQPGRTYRLIARSKADGRLMVGEVQVRPPESRLLIPVSEDHASGTTPALPGAPESLNPRRPTPAPPNGATAPADPPSEAGLGAPRAADPGPRSDPPADNPPSSNTARFNVPTPAPPPPGLPAIGADDSRRSPIEPQSFSAGPARSPSPMTPSCLVQAGRLRYMALNDLDGQPWDFAQHRGRLVLLDFWGTWCTPCLRALPEVARLNSQFADRGLEVVGIACEKVGPVEGARRVRQTQARISGLDYRILLADEYGRCPVQSQFQIASYPTLVLLDSDGTIIWRGNDVAEAERVIRKRLAY
jgi:thiol-disulfide isomerase/thioredoxin